ncbi:hypothetical protein AX16_001832 [Volvariella volvacea WC 439]|nr:hypothetical protein AX16_001832 [Volvariella volvacea WC 439]
MLLASIFLAVLAQSLASPTPVTVPASPVPSPLGTITAVLTGGAYSAHKTRTIFDILYSCLGIIFLCTYMSIHHNIPDQNHSWARKTALKVRTMLYAVLAPEVVIMWALRQRILAGEMANSAWGKERKWTRTHGFFLQMGGLMLEIEKGKKYEVILGGQTSRLSTLSEARVENIPRIRQKEIADHGKGDILAKAIVVLQTSWFVVQCIARHVEGLVLTELELVTLAFAALNVITYVLWWDKPLNVEYPIYIDKEGNRVDGPEDIEEEAWYVKLWNLITGKSSWKVLGSCGHGASISQGVRKDFETGDASKILWKEAVEKPFAAIFGPLMEMTNVQWHRAATSVHPFYAAWLDGEQHRLLFVYASAIGVLFGGIHLIGWNYPSLTTTELWLWRSCSLVVTVIPAIITISWPLKIDWWRKQHSAAAGWYSSDPLVHCVLWFLVIRVGSPLYIAARIAIIFLAFFSLRRLPESAYKDIDWSDFIPHI